MRKQKMIYTIRRKNEFVIREIHGLDVFEASALFDLYIKLYSDNEITILTDDGEVINYHEGIKKEK